MLDQRRRRWASIKPALGERLVFDEVNFRGHARPNGPKQQYEITLTRCLSNSSQFQQTAYGQETHRQYFHVF